MLPEPAELTTTTVVLSQVLDMTCVAATAHNSHFTSRAVLVLEAAAGATCAGAEQECAITNGRQ